MNNEDLITMNKILLTNIQECINLMHRRYPVGYSYFCKIIGEMSKLLNMLHERQEYKIYFESITECFQTMEKALESDDWIFLTDIMEDDLTELLKKLQTELMYWSSAEDYLENNICFIADKSMIQFIQSQDLSEFELINSIDGYMTAYSKIKKVHFGSILSPVRDAKVLAESILKNDCEDYFVYGMTNPYVIYEILKKHPFSKVVAVENNPAILKLGLMLCDLSNSIRENEESRLRVVYVPDLVAIFKELRKKEKFEIYIDSLAAKMAIDVNVRETMLDLAVKTNCIREQVFSMYINFYHLQNKKLEDFSKLKGLIEGKKTYVVAAGPSLDKMIERLKNREKDSAIICVGTVLRKLLNEGIRPDVAIIIDATILTTEQIDGIENESVPLVMFSTANAIISDIYKGPIYIAYQKDFDMSEQIAIEKGYTTFETGGSVSGAALQLAVLSEAKEIILVGFDFAFPNGKAYASDTNREICEKSTYTDLLVKSTTGDMIPTIASFMIYREWIEKYLETYSHPLVYNTGWGSEIKGTINIFFGGN